MTDFTVAICSYNGSDRLPKLLEALTSQAHTEHFSWEVLIIDNNSSDDTALVVQSYQEKFGQPVIRYCFEPRQGLAFARRRAVKEMVSPLIGFLDDDTIPTSHWVSEAFEFGRSHPQAGAYGSEILGDFEVEPPPNFQRIQALLALIQRGSQPFQYSTHKGVLPAGAGMVIRRDVWLRHVAEQPYLAGVSAKSLATKGEDMETLSYIRQAGYPIWHNPKMQILHQIPRERLQHDYLFSVCRAVGLNRYPLRMLNYPTWQRPIAVLAHAFKDMLHLLSYVCQNLPRLYRGEVVANCEFKLRWYSLVSPWFHLRNQPQRKSLRVG